NLKRFCDVLVVADDASTDGTREYLQREIPADHLVLVDPAEQDFRMELFVKQRMLEIVHRIEPKWIWWADGDEILDRPGVEGIREFLESMSDRPETAWRYH